MTNPLPWSNLQPTIKTSQTVLKTNLQLFSETKLSDSNISNDDLPSRVAAGDEQALAEAFGRYRLRLRNVVIFRMDAKLRGRVDPDDILQESYLQASQRQEHFAAALVTHPDASLFVWLRLIVTQTLVDAHRRHVGAQKRAAGREVAIHGSPGATSASIADCLLGHLTSPSRAAIREELGEKLREAIATMNQTDQEVIALRHFEELTNSEVAEVLGIEVKAASIRYVRAIKRLKEVLEQVPGIGGLEAIMGKA